MVMLELPTPAGTTEELFTAVWHVAVTRPGMFPMQEARCPCEKAPCGLVIPRLDVACDVHTTQASLHQAHPGQDCRSPRQHRSGRWLGLLRRGRNQDHE